VRAIEQLVSVRDMDLVLPALQNKPKSITEDDVRLAHARAAVEQQSLVKWKAQLDTALRDLQKQLDALRQEEVPDCQDELMEASEVARQGREPSPIRHQINEIVAETKRISRGPGAGQAPSPALETLRQKNRAMISRVRDAVTQLEAAIHQRQEREKFLQATGDRKLPQAVTALSADFFELAQLEQGDREILDDLNDLSTTLTGDNPTDLLSDLDQVVERVIVRDLSDVTFANSRERQQYLALVPERKQLIGKSHRPKR
jgi:hypothetical protein